MPICSLFSVVFFICAFRNKFQVSEKVHQTSVNIKIVREEETSLAQIVKLIKSFGGCDTPFGTGWSPVTMATLPKLSRSMRAHTDLDIRRELTNRPEERPTLQIFRSKEAKR